MQQDTTKIININLQDSIRILSDTVPSATIPQADSVRALPPEPKTDSIKVIIKTAPKKELFINTDTTSVCRRNSIIDITFYDSTNVLKNIKSFKQLIFPINYIERSQKEKTELKASLIKHLNKGEKLPFQPFHNDWILGIILVTAFLYSLIRTSSRELFPDFKKYFLLRGINDPPSRDVDAIFHWQSTIQNLISFLVIGMFAFYAISFYKISIYGITGIKLYLIGVAVIITAVTLRHFVCIIAGNISDEREVFKEYLVGIYHFYRFTSLFLFIVIIIMTYVLIIPLNLSFTTGLFIVGAMYLVRILRLLLIFINANISIFYLILYLCALEILPVLILFKYFTGLI